MSFFKVLFIFFFIHAQVVAIDFEKLQDPARTESEKCHWPCCEILLIFLLLVHLFPLLFLVHSLQPALWAVAQSSRSAGKLYETNLRRSQIFSMKLLNRKNFNVTDESKLRLWIIQKHKKPSRKFPPLVSETWWVRKKGYLTLRILSCYHVVSCSDVRWFKNHNKDSEGLDWKIYSLTNCH